MLSSMKGNGPLTEYRKPGEIGIFMNYKHKYPNSSHPSFKVLLLPYQGPDFSKRYLPGLRIQPSGKFCYSNQSVLEPRPQLGLSSNIRRN